MQSQWLGDVSVAHFWCKLVWKLLCMSFLTPSRCRSVTSHLICAKRQGHKYEAALQYNTEHPAKPIHIVSEDWIFDCLRCWSRQMEQNYSLVEEVIAPNGGACLETPQTACQGDEVEVSSKENVMISALVQKVESPDAQVVSAYV